MCVCVIICKHSCTHTCVRDVFVPTCCTQQDATHAPQPLPQPHPTHTLVHACPPPPPPDTHTHTHTRTHTLLVPPYAPTPHPHPVQCLPACLPARCRMARWWRWMMTPRPQIAMTRMRMRTGRHGGVLAHRWGRRGGGGGHNTEGVCRGDLAGVCLGGWGLGGTCRTSEPNSPCPPLPS